MKKSLFFLLGAVVISAGNLLYGQIGMSIKLNRVSYMQFEPVYAKITFRNDTGKALLFGKSPRLQGFLMMEITGVDGRIVPKRKNKEISIDGLILGPGEIRSIIVPVNEYYDIDKVDNYKIHAYVAHSMVNKEYKSPDTFFQVEHGAVIWKKNCRHP